MRTISAGWVSTWRKRKGECMKNIAMTASLQPHYLYSIFLPVPFGAYLFCSAKMNLVRVMQLVSIASMVAMVGDAVLSSRQWRILKCLDKTVTGLGLDAESSKFAANRGITLTHPALPWVSTVHWHGTAQLWPGCALNNRLGCRSQKPVYFLFTSLPGLWTGWGKPGQH